jgi:hypothetical protein
MHLDLRDALIAIQVAQEVFYPATATRCHGLSYCGAVTAVSLFFSESI